MTRFPLLFGRRELVEGNGFVARVVVHGRALLVDEDGEFWVEGVNPGGFAAHGATTGEALAQLCEELRTILFDIATGTRTFEEFRLEAERFFAETNETAEAEWKEAVEQVRAGLITADWLEKKPAESPLGISVEQVDQPKASNNKVDDAALAA